MKIKQLIRVLGSEYTRNKKLEDFEVKGISCNSKQVSDNYIFVAIKGSIEDGNRFITEAINKGAKAIVIQSAGMSDKLSVKIPAILVKDARLALAKLSAEFYGRPSAKIKVVGITGTNGKTTVSYLIETLLETGGLSPAVIGTINYRFNNKVIPSKNTTPGPVELQSMLKKMLRENINYVIMEVSSHSLDQNRIEGVEFHSSIFTNLTQDHLDYHKTLTKYFEAKAKLFKNMKPGSFAVINNDDRYAKKIKKLTRAKIITYGIDSKADLVAKDISLGSLGTEFSVVNKEGEVNLNTKLIGKHNVYNILAAYAWAQTEGFDISAIKSGIEGLSHIPGRLERVDFNGDFAVYVDYAHTEDALSRVLLSLRQIYKKRIILVFGCGGERDKIKRPKMGRRASELADWVIITNDNPRSEDPEQIIRDIKKGLNKKNFCVIPGRFEAIKRSLSLAGAGDVVLIAGKGHENYQIIKDRTIHFDDRETVRECLRSLSY